MSRYEVALNPPLLVVSPNSQEFNTATECWNSYLLKIRTTQNLSRFSLEIHPLSERPVHFDPAIYKLFPDGVVESTKLSEGHDGNGNYQLYTQATIEGMYMLILGPCYSYPYTEKIRRYILIAHSVA